MNIVKTFKPLLIQAFTIVSVLLTMLVSCKEKHNDSAQIEQHKHMVDSIFSSIESLDSLNDIIAEYEKQNDIYALIVAYKNIGKKYRNKSCFEEAIMNHQQGLRLAVIMEDTVEQVRALNDLGTDYRRLGVLDMASDFHMQALTLTDKYSDKTTDVAHKNRVVSLNGLGNVLLTLNDTETADSILRLALQGEHELGSALGQAINYANLGSLFEEKGEIDSAWVYYRNSMAQNELAHSDIGIALCHIHFGRLLEKQKKYNESKKEYLMAYNDMKRNADEWHWLESCIALGCLDITMGNLAEAKSYLEEAKTTAAKIKSKEHLAEIYELFYNIYKREGNTEAALENYIRSDIYSDSVMSPKTLNGIQDMRLRIERQRKQDEIDLANKNLLLEKKSKTSAYIVLWAVVVTMFLIAGFMFYVIRGRLRRQEELKKMQEARERFFTNITHEFRTPLTVIQGLAAELLKNSDSKSQHPIDQRETARTILHAGSCLMQLVNQLLDINKVQSAIGMSKWYHGNIVAFIEMVKESFREFAVSKHIDLIYKPMQNEVEMDFVPDYMHKILQNLISNSLKFTAELGKIEIVSSVVGRKFQISVSDNGCGIDEKALLYIFEPFYQAGHDSQNIGSGIGLSLVKQLVEHMDGHISVESKKGKGTRFTIDIPLKHGTTALPKFDKTQYVEPDFPVFENSEPVAETNSEGGEMCPTVLVVEDNNDVAIYIGTLLRGKYNVHYAVNGVEGLDKAKELMPDIIITDIMMPEMDGYELCSEVRASELLSHIPLIIVTAKQSEEDRIKGLEAGADAFLIKPFNAHELALRMSNLLNMRRQIIQRSKAISDPTASKENCNEENISGKRNAAEREFLTKVSDVAFSLMRSGKLDAETLASHVFVSRVQLNRKLQAVTGLNTSAFIIRTRINYAKRLLDSDINMPVGDIAVKCGYDDIAYFSRVFKQVTQLTPSQWRKRIDK